MSELINSLLCFDCDADVRVIDRRLPHWSQAGVVTFITWRTCDSMPKAVLEQWREERGNWLRKHGIETDGALWRKNLLKLSLETRRKFLDIEWSRWNDSLDACAGACELKRPDLAEIVAECLLHFDGDRYAIFDFVVMPNHVHLLAAFPSDEQMLTQCESWKRFTSTRINKMFGRQGRFWQSDAFDRLVRNEEQFEHLRRYIAENPAMAKPPPGEFRLYSKAEASPTPARTVGPRKDSTRRIESPHSASAGYLGTE